MSSNRCLWTGCRCTAEPGRPYCPRHTRACRRSKLGRAMRDLIAGKCHSVSLFKVGSRKIVVVGGAKRGKH